MPAQVMLPAEGTATVLVLADKWLPAIGIVRLLMSLQVEGPSEGSVTLAAHVPLAPARCVQ